MSGPEDPKCLRRNPQIYRLIDAKLWDHVCIVSVTSDHLTSRVWLLHPLLRSDLLRVVCPIERVQLGVISLLSDHLLEKYRLAIAHVHFLLKNELDETPATLNHYFNDNLEKWYAKFGRAMKASQLMGSAVVNDVCALRWKVEWFLNISTDR